MSTTIDQKVVEMRFDNQQFEKNISTTMGSLEKLKQSLNLSGASKGLEEVGHAASKCDMSSLGSAVESVKMKFSALEVMGMTALANITNSAVNAGKRIVSALTIDPITTGFSEYELKMGSIQTIMAATGESLESVNGYLGELNEYSDRTIYSFSDMTQNIGKFTNAGVSLEDSVAAIKGISNVAAVSGANTNEASRAMYNFAQALSSGYVKLIDWKSIELANMGTVEFKEQLLESAVAAGTLTKAGDGMYKTLKGTTISATKGFNDSLQEQWMTTETLVSTLKKYTDETTDIGKKAYAAATEIKTLSQLYDVLKETAQSGWAQTWEIIVGDFEEAKQFMSYLSDAIGGVISASAEARNELLENWKVLGGRTALLDSVKNIFEGIASVIKPIKDAFRDIFPPMTAERLLGFTEGLKNLTARLKISDESADKLKRTFKGVFAILDIVKTIFVAVVNAVGSMLTPMGNLGGGILDITANIGDWLVALRDTIKDSEIFTKVFTGIADILAAASKGVSGFIKFVNSKIVAPGFEFLSRLVGDLGGAMTGIGEIANSMKGAVVSAFDTIGSALASCTLIKVLQGVWNIMKVIGTGVAKIFGAVAGKLADVFAAADFEGLLGIVNGLVSGGLLIGIIKFVKGFITPLEDMKDILGGTLEKLTGILDGVCGSLEAFQSKLKAEALMKIAIAVGILAAALIALAFIDTEKLFTAVSAMALLFTELITALSVLSSLNAGSKFGAAKLVMLSKALTSLATAVLILAVAMKLISTLSLEELRIGLTGVTTGLLALVVAVNFLPESKIQKAASAIKKMSVALVILAAAMKIIGTMSWEEMAIGLIGIAGGLAILVAAVNLLPDKKVRSAASAITKMSIALVILAAAMKIMATMSWDDIARGLVATVGGLAALVAAANLLPKDMALRSLGIISLTTALVILAAGLKIMSSMSWDDIARGMVALAGSLTAVIIATKLMKSALPGAVAMTIIAPALLLLAGSLKIMSTMSWGDVARGMVSLGGAMLILAAGLALMKNSIAGSVALLVAAAALGALTPVLILLGSMSWSSIAKGLITIAGAFAIIGIAGSLLAPCVPAILALAGALVLIGIGTLAAGAGLMVAGAGLSALAVGLTTLVASLGAVVSGIVGIVRAVILGIAEGIIAFCEVIASGAPVIGDAIKALVVACCDVLVECIPLLANSALKLVVGLLDALVSYTPQIVDSLSQFIIGVLNGIAKNIPEFIQALVNIFTSVFTGAVDALANMDMGSLMKGLASIGLMAGIVAALAAVVPLIPQATVGAVGVGIVVSELAIVLAAIGALAQIPGLDWLINEGGDFLQTIGTAIGKFIGGIAGGITQGFTSSLPQIANDLSLFMTNLRPFIDGIKMVDESVLSSVKSLVSVILAISAASVVESVSSWLTGGSSMTAFASELIALGHGLKGFSDAVSGVIVDNVIAATSAAKALVDMSNAIPNEGGVVSWFTGENSVSKFANELPILGYGLLGFSNAVVGIVPENIIAAANAAKALAEMTTAIPNEGGMKAWFSGESSVSKFSTDIITLGYGLKGFSDAVTGIVPESVIAAANAAKVLADMTATIPNEGGMISWFAGESSVSKFAGELPVLGQGLKGFSDAVAGTVPENVTSAANAAKSLSDMASTIPDEGGIKAWFAGDNSVSKFAGELPVLGRGLKGFSDSVTGIVPENIVAASNAAKALAEMTAIIPKTEGIVAWFTGDTNIADFANKLPTLGKGLKSFGDSVAGITPENVTAAANAAKSIGEMTNTVPTDTSKIITFGENLIKFGSSLKTYFTTTSGITDGSVKATSSIIDTIKKVTEINADGVKSGASAITALTKAIKNASKITADSTSGFVSALKKLGTVSADAFVKPFEDIKTKMTKIGKTAIEAFAQGVEDSTKTAKTAAEGVVKACAEAMKAKVGVFKSAGMYLVEGFADGIDANRYMAKARARAMAAAAAKAAAEELDEHSPSKVGYGIGDYFGVAFVNGIADNIEASYKTSAKMASAGKEGLNDAIRKVGQFLESDIDMSPTIRPVLDLSQVEHGVRSLSGMLNMGTSVGVLANVGAISYGMARRNQNGDMGEVTKAIGKLGDKLDKSGGNTYIIDGVTYDDGSNVANAMEEIVHAAKVERRT